MLSIEYVVNRYPFSGKNEDCKEAYKLLFTAIIKVIMPIRNSCTPFDSPNISESSFDCKNSLAYFTDSPILTS
jgi:hypothetical protein